MENKTVLIVYGSLAPGESNHHIISHIDGQWSKASIKGRIIDNGWSSRTGYPEFQRTSEEDSETVEVFAFISEELDEHWDHIDAFERTESYIRSKIPCVLEGGKIIDAFIYESN